MSANNTGCLAQQTREYQQETEAGAEAQRHLRAKFRGIIQSWEPQAAPDPLCPWCCTISAASSCSGLPQKTSGEAKRRERHQLNLQDQNLTHQLVFIHYKQEGQQSWGAGLRPRKTIQVRYCSAGEHP